LQRARRDAIVSFMQLPKLQSIALVGAAIALAAVLGSRAGAASPDNRDVANRLAAQFVEAENSMNVDLFDTIFTADYIQHNPDVEPGLAGVKKAFADEFNQLAAGHITAHTTIEAVLVDGDHVVLRQNTTLVKGDKHYQVREIDEWRIVDGRFGEHWDSDSSPRPVPAASP
jgi:predicted SnoaL-like aldol condensation-catalyzing enzyme